MALGILDAWEIALFFANPQQIQFIRLLVSNSAHLGASVCTYDHSWLSCFTKLLNAGYLTEA